MRACSAFFPVASFLKSSSGVIFALTLFLKGRGACAFLNMTLELSHAQVRAVCIFCWMEELCSSSWLAFFASELVAVLADYSCLSWIAFAPYCWTYMNRLLGLLCRNRSFVGLLRMLLVNLSEWNLVLDLFVLTGVSA